MQKRWTNLNSVYQEQIIFQCLPSTRFPSSPSSLSLSLTGTCELWQCFACFHGANHREWVSVYTQSVYKSCSQWNQWLTGSCWDGRRCHRKTKKSVCECKNPTSLLLFSFFHGGLPFFACGSHSILSVFNLFVDAVWNKSGNKLKWVKCKLPSFLLYHYVLGLMGYFHVNNLQTFCSVFFIFHPIHLFSHLYSRWNDMPPCGW